MYLSRWCMAQWPAWPCEYQQREGRRGSRSRSRRSSSVGAATVIPWLGAVVPNAASIGGARLERSLRVQAVGRSRGVERSEGYMGAASKDATGTRDT